MHPRKRGIGVTGLAVLLLGFGLASARAGEPVNKSLLGVAVKGTDVVAYFTDGKTVPGSADFEYAWRGAKWRFASQAHRDQFAANPEKYAPQYGGFCAWAMSQGRKAPVDPDCWKIVNDKLYLNYSRDIQAKWTADIPGLIAKADGFWKQMAGQ